MSIAHATERTVTLARQVQAMITARAGVPETELSATAPAQYTMCRGGTLQAISGKYLKRPYHRPELWGINRKQTRDPYLIYPSQTLYLHHAGGRVWSSSLPASVDGSTVRLSPHTHASGQGGDAISSILSIAIESFLTQPIVVDEDMLTTPARIFSPPEDHVYLGKGEDTYACGLPQSEGGQAGTEWRVYHPVRPLKNSVMGNVLGYGADFLGTLCVVCAAADPQAVTKMEVLSSKEEMGVGSRLIPSPPHAPVCYVPHVPKSDVHGTVVKVTDGVRFGGTDQVIALSTGSQQGLEPGYVLLLTRAGAIVKDATAGNEAVQLPVERYGLAFVFRMLPHVAYALVTDASSTVEVGDSVGSPMS